MKKTTATIIGAAALALAACSQQDDNAPAPGNDTAGREIRFAPHAQRLTRAADAQTPQYGINNDNITQYHFLVYGAKPSSSGGLVPVFELQSWYECPNTTFVQWDEKAGWYNDQIVLWDDGNFVYRFFAFSGSMDFGMEITNESFQKCGCYSFDQTIAPATPDNDRLYCMTEAMKDDTGKYPEVVSLDFKHAHSHLSFSVERPADESISVTLTGANIAYSRNVTSKLFFNVFKVFNFERDPSSLLSDSEFLFKSYTDVIAGNRISGETPTTWQDMMENYLNVSNGYCIDPLISDASLPLTVTDKPAALEKDYFVAPAYPAPVFLELTYTVGNAANDEWSRKTYTDHVKFDSAVVPFDLNTHYDVHLQIASGGLVQMSVDVSEWNEEPAYQYLFPVQQ